MYAIDFPTVWEGGDPKVVDKPEELRVYVQDGENETAKAFNGLGVEVDSDESDINVVRSMGLELYIGARASSEFFEHGELTDSVKGKLEKGYSIEL